MAKSVFFFFCSSFIQLINTKKKKVKVFGSKRNGRGKRNEKLIGKSWEMLFCWNLHYITLCFWFNVCSTILDIFFLLFFTIFPRSLSLICKFCFGTPSIVFPLERSKNTYIYIYRSVCLSIYKFLCICLLKYFCSVNKQQNNNFYRWKMLRCFFFVSIC